jgi:hypothetical protein
VLRDERVVDQGKDTSRQRARGRCSANDALRKVPEVREV